MNSENNSTVKDNLTENLKSTAEPAAAEDDAAASVTGKFKDVKTLLKAYSDLEAEFTRRSQRLKELEAGNKTVPSSDGAKAQSSVTDEQLIDSALSNAKVRDAVIGEYLNSLVSATNPPVIAGGGGVPAPRNTPKSVKEAGALAKRFLKI